ncbi:cobalamin biosynthesis protein [Methylocella silvestris]|uniref:Cobalamin biosynthesis protein CobE n=1 Tax=Methylocella silvestris TaxID=199596 RepID=A0A2J7TMK3_METSI|nr:cobalamin biosynthesis protein [Methylocella silvestris]PNG27990.1 cobalamin biosynthesis protein CobE [Methylocella silvestris]
MTLAIGVGCRKNCPGGAIETLIRRAILRAGCAEAPAAIYAHAAKNGEPGLFIAAERLGLPLVFLPPQLLQEASPRAETRSVKVEALFGLPSLAETAALAGAGAGSRLVLARISAAGASCAIASTDPQ